MVLLEQGGHGHAGRADLGPRGSAGWRLRRDGGHGGCVIYVLPCRGQEFGNEKRPATRADQQRRRPQRMLGEHAAELIAQLGKLRGSPRLGQGLPLRSVGVARVQPDHAREPGAAAGLVFRPVVGARVLVVRGSEFAGEAIHIGGGREKFIHHVRFGAAPGDAPRQRAQRGAHDALVDEFAARQAQRVAAAGREDAAVPEGDEVGGGAADVDDYALRIFEQTGGVARRGQPVRRGDVLPHRAGRGGVAPGCVPGEEARRRQGAAQRLGDAPHAVFAVGEGVNHFARHRHRVAVAVQVWPARARCGERAFELAQALPQRAGPLRRVEHGATPHQGGLDVGATDVPADNAALNHSGLRRGAGPTRRGC